MATSLERLTAALERRFAPAVLVAGAIGLAAPRPGRWLVDHAAIGVLLFLLVLASALGVEPGILHRLGPRLPRLGVVLGAGTVAGVASAWAASLIVSRAALRHGVLALGVAPAEIATVAMAGLAGADPAIAAALLVASTAVSVVVAGPVLSALAGSSVDTTGTILELAVVVGIPMAAGLVLRPVGRRVGRLEEAIAPISIGLVLALVELVASQIHPSVAYLAVAGAIVIFVALTTAAAIALGRLFDPATRPAVVLSVAVRDFAVASGIAEAAFGAEASGPLGIYGVVVIATGAVLVRVLRTAPNIGS